MKLYYQVVEHEYCYQSRTLVVSIVITYLDYNIQFVFSTEIYICIAQATCLGGG